MKTRQQKNEEAKICQSTYTSLSLKSRLDLVRSRGGSKKELARLTKKSVEAEKKIDPKVAKGT